MKTRSAISISDESDYPGLRSCPQRDGMPASSAGLLALLPAALRSAVLAHFSLGSTNGVGTGVGTNDEAAGVDDPDGVVSR